MKRLIRLKRIAILTELITSLRAKSLWAGELQLQQAVYLLQEAFGVPLGHEFIWNYLRPRSYDLDDELESLRADKQLEFELADRSCSPRYRPTVYSERPRAKFPQTLAHYSPSIMRVAEILAAQEPSRTCHLCCAIFLLRGFPDIRDVDELAGRLTQRLPRLSWSEARIVFRQADELLASSRCLTEEEPRLEVPAC